MIESPILETSLPSLLAGERGKSKHSHTISSVFRNIIEDYSEKKPKDISIMLIAKNYNVQHRRVYDFFNLLTSLGACESVVRGKIGWLGLEYVQGTIKQMYINIECSSMDVSMRELFSIGQSPSLGAIATRLICLYLYLGVDRLILKNVSAILHDPRSDIRSLERRIYLVLNFLEVIGIVAHTVKTSEYKLMLPTEEIITDAMVAKHNYAKQSHNFNFEKMMSRLDDVYVASMQRERREVFFSSFQ